MKKYLTMALCLMVLVISGCAKDNKNNINTAITDTSTEQQSNINIDFHTEENNIVISYLDTIFNIELPANFAINKRDLSQGNFNSKYLSDNDSFAGVYEILISGNVVGAIGIAEYTVNTEPAELIDVYGGIALPNNYHFCIDEGNYHPVENSNVSAAGITKVYYSPMISENVGYDKDETYNEGILAYTDKNNVFIALEFETGVFDNENLFEIAENIKCS